MSHPSPQATASATFAPSRDHWWPLADRPTLALAILFLVGIWVGSRWPMAPLWIALGLLGALVALSARRGSLGQVALCVAALASGALLHAYQHRLRPDDVSLLVADDSAITVEGFVTAELPSGSDTRRLIVAIRRLDVSGEWQPASGKLLARIRNVEGPLEGVGVRCRGRVSLPSSGTNPGQFDYAEALSRRQVGLVLRADSLVEAQAGPAAPGMWLRRQAATLRRGIVQRLRGSMPGANADYYTGLLAGIVFGMEVTPVPESTAESFRRTGTIHLLVVSGAQITMIASAVLFLLRARRLKWWHGIVVIGPLAFFALMVGAGPSVARALAMCVVFLIGRVGEADYDPYTALGLAALVICIFETEALFSIGAQLSFAATLGVLAGIRSLPHAHWAMSRPIRPALIVAAGAIGSWLMVTPLLAYHFAAFPLIGSVANLLTVPLCALVMACAAVVIPLSFISVAIASVPAWAARSVLAAMVSINDLCAALPLAYASSAHFSVWHCLGWYGALAVGAVVVRGRWWEGFTPKRLLGGALGLVLVLSLWFAVSAYRPGELTVTFLDVGHGQCCVVEAPSGHTMMVDAGSYYSTREGQRCAREIVLPFLARRGIGRLDFIVLTHPDADHCNALAPILREIPVGLILESFPAPDHKLYSQLAATAAHQGVGIERTFAGGHINLGRGVSANVIWPSGTPSDETYGDNDRSVVLVLCYGETRLLLTGDIEQAAEAELVARRAPLRADFVQVPHHGGARSSTEAFLERVRPSVAVISCGSADPDHPHPATLARYRRRGVRVLRTDIDGAVTVISNGARLTVRSHLRSQAAQKRSPICAWACAIAASRASGLSSPIARVSGGSLPATAESTSRAIRDRRSGASSKRRSRKRRMLASSSGVRLRAAALALGARSSGGSGAPGAG